MDNRITYRQVVARLEENGLAYGVLDLQNGWPVVITQRGGRILGPFLGIEGESLFWTNGVFSQAGAFEAFLASGHWNLGGDRVWIAPEIQYSVRDRSDYWGTIATPPQVDPGQYTLDRLGPDWWQLSQEMALQAHNLASGEKRLRLKRVIRPAPDPLRYVGAYPHLVDGVAYAGYEQIVTLTECRHDAILSEAWSLTQLNPGGVLLIPASPRAEVTDYYRPVDDTVLSRRGNHLRLQVTGARQYKVGIKAAHVLGRLGYFRELDDGRAMLAVRNFFNDPTLPYSEEPDRPAGCRGHSIHVYNDDGGLGGFGELECNLPTIGGETGRSSSTDHLLMWLYVGPADRIETIALHLLGVEP